MFLNKGDSLQEFSVEEKEHISVDPPGTDEREQLPWDLAISEHLYIFA